MGDETGIVFTAEFLRRLRSRAYIVGTLIGIVSVGLLILIPSIIDRALGGTTKALVLAGPADLRNPARALLERDPAVRIVDEVDAAPQPPTLAFLDRHGKASAVITLVRTAKGLKATAFARDPGGFPTGQIGRALMPLNMALGTGLSTSQVSPFARNPLEVRGVETRYATEASADLARAVAYGLVFILYFAIIFNGQAIMSSVAEEKTSRVAELLVATIAPAALLAGKVLATGATGLIQVALWGTTGFLLSSLAFHDAGTASAAASQATLSLANALSPGEIAAFVAFFLIGYFQYSMLFAAAASLISRTEDLGTVTTPLMMPIVIAFLIAQYALISPNGSVAVIASLIPLVSPFVMFMRLVITEVPLWQTVLSFALNIAVLIAIVPLSGKVYRIGMLMYGRPPKLSQIWTVLRT